MKKEYIEPTMRLAELRHRCHLLAGSDTLHGKTGLNNWDRSPIKTYSGEDDTVTDEEDVI
jgi:hypothetical protein